MKFHYKLLFASLMITALMFGFLHLFIPGSTYNFERLHIFLFNLCSGGTILLHFTENKKNLSKKALTFLVLSVSYAVLAFLKIYIPAMVISIVLAVIVETVRIKKFSIFPLGFFRRDEPVYRKFHQASLLCLSMGLFISCMVILNNEYIKLVSMPKLKLDTFFLGFSFPLSLITMSLIFSFMKEETGAVLKIIKEAGFWTVNLGVIIFFMFIIFELLTPQIFVTSILFLAVVVIFYLYYRLGEQLQQKNFLTSGVCFLLMTAVTGIAYIILQFTSDYSPSQYKWLLRLHAFASLYGWNLCGLAVICRFKDFPIRMHSKTVIAFHWVTVLVLAPLGSYFRIFSVLAILFYALILVLILFSSGVRERQPYTSSGTA
jgi:hypothetical protein